MSPHRLLKKNKCSYCLSAHHFLGQKFGLSAEEINKVRIYTSSEEKTQIGLQFVKKILEDLDNLSEKDLIRLRHVGYSDGEILEIIGNVSRNIYTNLINIVSKTEVDWPVLINPITK